MGLELFYVRDIAPFLAPAQAEKLLGVIGYNAARPAGLAPECPFLAAPLAPLGGPAYEIWRGDRPTRPCALGPVQGACGPDFAFGGLELAEGDDIEAAAAAAYEEIFDWLEAGRLNVPIRFWNYLTGITEPEGGVERYRRFNTGRQRALGRRLRQSVPPAASGVGGRAGRSIIYVLAAKAPAMAVENPRQVSAYRYPPVHGPTSPSFSRAGLHELDGAKRFFISGTASIVGHETRHAGDAAAQLAETMRNLDALRRAAAQTAPGPDWAVKIYLRDPAQRPAVERALDELFGAKSQRLYLQADICRTDLLLEIEACRLPGPPLP